MKPIAMPDTTRRSTSFFIPSKVIFCLVITRCPPIASTASSALQSAISPEASGIPRTKSPMVPKIAMETAIISRARFVLF